MYTFQIWENPFIINLPTLYSSSNNNYMRACCIIKTQYKNAWLKANIFKILSAQTWVPNPKYGSTINEQIMKIISFLQIDDKVFYIHVY